MDFQHLKEFLECSICLEQLDESSRVLPCQHTFCLQCLENLVGNGIIKCPECRAVYSGTLVNNLPRNVLLMRILDGMKQDKYLEKSDDLNGGKGTTCKAIHNLHELSKELEFLPHGKALFDFAGRENDDVPFKAGDLIFLLQKAANMDWFDGLVNGVRGLVPANYVEVVVPIPSINDDTLTAPFALALYNLDDPSEEVISFKQGDVIHVLKVLDGDPNWGEGYLGNQYGIFPFNYTKLNDCASKMLTSNSNEDIHNYTNDKSSNKLSPWVKLTDVNKRHTIHLENPNNHAEAIQALQSSKQSRKPLHAHERRRASGPLLETTLCSDMLVPNVTQRSSSERRLFSSSSDDSRTSNNNSKTDVHYIALYDYAPCNDDEIPLMKGKFYTVIANYEDGWSRAIDPQTSKSGLIPSNYVKLVMNISQPTRMRSGSQPIEPTTNTEASGAVQRQASLLSAIKKRTVKRQAPAPPPYSVLPTAATGNSSAQRQPKPLPNIPVEPPPPYSPQQHPSSGILSLQRSAQSAQAAAKERCRVIADYPPTENDELELKVGDIVVVKKKSSNGWYKGTCLRNGRTGLFPSSFVELMTR